MKTSILSTIGQTPLIQLNKLMTQSDFNLYGKLEFFNPGGSAKDRSAYRILTQAQKSGEIGPNTTIIESTSGNFGIALSQICRFLGLNLICVVDPRTNPQTQRIIKSFGTQVDMITEPDPVTGQYLQRRINRVQELRQEIPDNFWPHQYSNLENCQAHYFTMQEIAQEMENDVDYVFVATSTCGTLRGCSEYVKEHQLKTKIVAVDALGSAIFINPPTSHKRLIAGHGAGRRPELFRPGLADQVMHISDRECVIGCHTLLDREAIQAGGSSGAVVSAVIRLQSELPSGAKCVLILCDRGERYLDTVYSPAWVQEKLGLDLNTIQTFFP